MSAKKWLQSQGRAAAMFIHSARGERAVVVATRHTAARSCGLRSLCSRLLTLTACGFVLTGGGCSWWRSMTGQTAENDTSNAEIATTRPATTQMSDISVAPVPSNLTPANRPVVQGPLPLFYLVEQTGTLRVRNTQSGEEIISFDARATQIVRVDTSGVFLANKPVIGANLVPGNYAIEVVPSTAGIQSTQQRNALQSQ